MRKKKVEYMEWYYPRVLQAAHLVVLYIFLQTIVDFPLALYDYFNDTEWLYFPPAKVVVSVSTTLFILIYGYWRTQQPLRKVFPLKFFNPLILIPIAVYLAGSHFYLGIVNRWMDIYIPPPPWFWDLFSRIFENDYGFWGVVLKVAIIAPIIEELIFRGIIMHGFMRNYSKFSAIIISALMFALFHLNPWQFPSAFALGILLGWLMVRTRSILLCILGHSVNNLLVLVSIEYWQEINTHALMLLSKNDYFKLCSYMMLWGVVVMVLLTYRYRIKQVKT